MEDFGENNNSKVFSFKDLKNIVSFDFLKNKSVLSKWKFASFIFALLLVYISNSHIHSRTQRDNINLYRSMAQSKARYLTKTAELAKAKKRSQITKEIKRRGIDLHEPDTPPIMVSK